jgi:hypothetical protein
MNQVFAPGCALLLFKPDRWHAATDAYIEAH